MSSRFARVAEAAAVAILASAARGADAPPIPGTFVGAAGDERIVAVATDPSGRIYVAGTTTSTSAPWNHVSDGFRTSFVRRLAADGTAVDWHHTIRGRVRGLATDATGTKVAVVGEAYVGEGPAAPAVVGPGGGLDAFVEVLTTDGAVVRSHRIGASGDDSADGVAIDTAGVVHVVGRTTTAVAGAGLEPIAPPSGAERGAPAVGAPSDAWYARFSAAGATETLALFGGAAEDAALCVAARGDGGTVVVGGTSRSDGFPAAVARGATDGFVVCLARDGGGATSVAWVRAFATPGFDAVRSVAFGPTGDAFAAGSTDAAGLGTAGSFQPHALHADGFVARCTTDGALRWLTHFGGSGADAIASLAVLAGGDVVVAGTSDPRGPVTDPDLFTTAGAPRRTSAGSEAFVARIASYGASLGFATFVGGSGTEEATGLALLPGGDAVCAGRTTSANLGLSGGAQPTNAGSGDGFVARIAVPAGSAVASGLRSAASNGTAQLTWTPGVGAVEQRVVRRSPATEPSSLGAIATLAGSAASVTDPGVPLAITFDHWIETTDASGRSAWGAGARVQDMPVPAEPPFPLSAPEIVSVVRSGAYAYVTWADPSDRETGFSVHRTDATGATTEVARTGADVTSVRVPLTGVRGDVNSFRVAAHYAWSGPPAGSGTSEPSGSLSIPVETTFDVVPRRAALARIGDGRFVLAGRIDRPDGPIPFNPATDEFAISFGDPVSPSVLRLPAASLGWRARGDRVTWRSDRSAEDAMRGSVRIDRRTGAIRVRLRGFEAAAPLDRRFVVAVVAGVDTAYRVDMWRECGGGLRYEWLRRRAR